MPSKPESSESEPEIVEEEEEEEEEEEVEEVEEEEEEEEQEVEEEEEEEDNGEEEEEVEEEEEEEPEEEEENEEERSADSTPSPVNNDESSQEVETEGHAEDLRFQKSNASLAAELHDTSGGAVNPSNEPLDTEVKETSHVGEEDTKPIILSKDMVLVSSEDSNGCEGSHSDNKDIGSQPEQKIVVEACIDVQQKEEAHSGNVNNLSDVLLICAGKTKLYGADEKEIAAEALKKDGSADEVSNHSLETKQMDMQSGEDTKLKASSSTTSKRPRSLSPGAEFEDGNKRPAMVCDFFARGWCIKGTSCKFLHEKDGVTSTAKRTKQEVSNANSKDILEEDEGLRVENRKSSAVSETLASSEVNVSSLKSSLPSERIRLGEHGESQRPQEFLDKDTMHASPVVRGDLNFDTGNSWPHKVTAGGSQWKSSAGDDILRSSAMPLHHDNYNHRPDVISYTRSDSEEFGRGYSSSLKNLDPEQRFLSSGSFTQSSMYGNISSFPHEKYGSHTSGFYASPNSSFSSSLPPKGSFPKHQTYPLPGPASSQRSSVDGDQRYYSSRSFLLLRHSSSPLYPRFDPENLSLRGVHGDPYTSIGHVTPNYVNNWEPSVPFQPSFNFAAFMSASGSQYDPLFDSIDPPYGGYKTFPESSVSQGVTMHTMLHQQANGDTSSFDRQPQYGGLDKKMSSQGIGTLTTSAEATGIVVAEQQNKISVSKEEKPLKPGHRVNGSNAMDVDHDRNFSHQADGGKHNKESKILKLFRASLVEFVKDLVKPHWRDGHLSKDGHNTVVRKAVEKVLSTLQPNQIPNTLELTTNYFSLFRPKLTKLVEGYVGKYAAKT